MTTKSNTIRNYLDKLYPEWLAKSDVTDALNTVLQSSVSNAEIDPQTPEEKLQAILSLPASKIPTTSKKPVVVILAAGKGSRMGSHVSQKSLCPIMGRPALLHSLDLYRSFGCEHFVIIVGSGYQDVLEAIGTQATDVSYIFQEEQRGTGHAARLAGRFLKQAGYQGDLLVAMGDKFISRSAIQQMFDDHQRQQPDLLISSAAKKAWPDNGRLVMHNDNRIMAIVEKPDIVQRQLLNDFYTWPTDPVPCDEFKKHALSTWDSPKKLKQILSHPFWNALNEEVYLPKQNDFLPLLQSELPFDLDHDSPISPHALEASCQRVNTSVYLFSGRAFHDSIERLTPSNAQGELYLTDAVHDLTSNHHDDPYIVAASHIPDDYAIMGFNTPEDLAQVERIIQERGLM